MTEQNDGLEVLAELALNLRSSWNHSAEELWAQIDPELWAETSNPWVVVQSASPARLRELRASQDFRHRVLAARDRLNEALGAAGWFQKAHPGSPLARVAYFSMEFALAESLPIPVLYLARHGETAWSLSGQHTGRTDPPLKALQQRFGFRPEQVAAAAREQLGRE